MWDSSKINVWNTWKDVFSVSVVVEDLCNNSKWLITSVNGPNDTQSRKELWKELDAVREDGMEHGASEETGT